MLCRCARAWRCCCGCRFLKAATRKRRPDGRDCSTLDGGHLARVHVFLDRLPMMHRDGWTGNRVSNPTAFAWFVWERGYTGKPEIDRIRGIEVRHDHSPPGGSGMMRRTLPQRRAAETFDLRFWNHRSRSPSVSIRRHAGRGLHRRRQDGAGHPSIARDAGVVLSLAFQHGTPIETIRHAVTRNAAHEPLSLVGAIIDQLSSTGRAAR